MDDFDQDKDKQRKTKFKRRDAPKKGFGADWFYFFEVKHIVLPRVKQCKKKAENKYRAMQVKLAQKISALAKAKNLEDKKKALEDVKACRANSDFINRCHNMAVRGIETLKNILKNRVKQSYIVIVDFTVPPLPSEAKSKKAEKNKKKNKGKNKDKNENKDKNKDKANTKKDQLNKLRGISQDGPVGPVKDTGFVKAGEKINIDGLKLDPKFAAGENDNKVGLEDNGMSAGSLGQSQGPKKSLAAYRRRYGFTQAARRKILPQKVQNINMFDRGRSK